MHVDHNSHIWRAAQRCSLERTPDLIYLSVHNFQPIYALNPSHESQLIFEKKSKSLVVREGSIALS